MEFNGELFAKGLYEVAFNNIALWNYSHHWFNDKEKRAQAIKLMQSSTPSPREGIEQQLMAYKTHNSINELVKIKAPTFIIGGERDRIAMIEEVKELNENILYSSLKIFKDMANATHVEMPQEFFTYIHYSIDDLDLSKKKRKASAMEEYKAPSEPKPCFLNERNKRIKNDKEEDKPEVKAGCTLNP